MAITYFFAAAAGGFVLLAAIGIQALVALFSSIPLTRRHKAENPAFNTARAFRRIVQVMALVSVLLLVITALVIHFAPTSATMGYLFGMILAFLCSLKRMSPNDKTNQARYEEAYADCYPQGEASSDAAAKRLSVSPQEPAGDGEAPIGDAPAEPSDPEKP